MKIIKGICGFIVFVCIIAMALAAMTFEVETINLATVLLLVTALTLTALIAFIIYIAIERSDKIRIDFMKFIREEYSKKKRP